MFDFYELIGNNSSFLFKVADEFGFVGGRVFEYREFIIGDMDLLFKLPDGCELIFGDISKNSSF